MWFPSSVLRDWIAGRVNKRTECLQVTHIAQQFVNISMVLGNAFQELVKFLNETPELRESLSSFGMRKEVAGHYILTA
jgi:hypothetical protein